MKNKNEMVTIPLEEYKELLLKERPSNEDKLLLEKIIEVLESHMKYSDGNWCCIMEHVEIDDNSDTLQDIMKVIKLLDFERYMQIWNKIQTKERERKAQEEKIKQMNEAKEIRKEHENDK